MIKKKKQTAKTFRYPPLFLGHAVMFSMSVKLYIYSVICFYPDFRPTLIIQYPCFILCLSILG